MNASKKLMISAVVLSLSSAVYAQGAGGEGAGGGGTTGGNGMARGGANDGSTGTGAPVRSGMGDNTNQGPAVGAPAHHPKGSKHSSGMKSNGMNPNSGASGQ